MHQRQTAISRPSLKHRCIDCRCKRFPGDSTTPPAGQGNRALASLFTSTGRTLLFMTALRLPSCPCSTPFPPSGVSGKLQHFTQEDLTIMPSNKPAAEVRVGAVKAAIWPNQTIPVSFATNVTFSRIYKDAEGNWKSLPASAATTCSSSPRSPTWRTPRFRGRQRPAGRPGRRTAVLTAAVTRRGAKPRLFFVPLRESTHFKIPAGRA